MPQHTGPLGDHERSGRLELFGTGGNGLGRTWPCGSKSPIATLALSVQPAASTRCEYRASAGQ